MTKRFLSIRSIAMIATIALLAASVSAATIPAGTKVTVRLGQSLSSETARSGDTFDGNLAQDVVVNGVTIKAGAPVKGKVTFAKASGRLKTPGQISIRLTSIDGQTVTTTSVSRKGESHTKSNATKIGGGAAAGALIGDLAGGKEGAAIGGAVGAGGGTGVAAATGKKEIVLATETKLIFKLSAPFTVTMKKKG